MKPKYIATIIICSIVITIFHVCIAYPKELNPGNVITDVLSQIDQQEVNEKELISKYILCLRPRLKRKPEYLKRIVEAISINRKDVDPKIIVAILYQESSFREDAIGNNDIGIGQINAFYHCRAFNVTIQGLLKLETNIRVACKILNNLKDTKSQIYKNSWYSFYNTSKWEIKDENGVIVAGRKVYWYSILRHMKKIDRKLK